MANRNLLIDIGDNTRLDATFLGAGGSISSDGKTLTFPSGATTSNSRSKLSRATGKLFFKAIVSNNSSVGVCDQYETTTAAQGVGTTADSWGVFQNAATWGYRNGGAGTIVGAWAGGDPLCVAVDFAAGKLWLGKATAAAPNTIVWALGGNPALGTTPTYSNLNTSGTTALNIARKWFLMASAGPTIGSTQIITDYASLAASLPAGFAPWGEIAFVAANGVATRPGDTQYSRYYDGRITAEGDPVYSRAVSVWTMQGGTAKPTSAISNIDLNNGDGALDFLQTFSLRDVPITGWLYTNSPAAALIPDTSTWSQAFSVIGDHAEEPDEQTLRIVLKDKFARLDQAAQDNVYAAGTPNANLVGQLRPLALGVCIWVPVTAEDAANLQFDLMDGAQVNQSAMSTAQITGAGAIGTVSEVIDQGVTITQGTGWAASKQVTANGITRLTNPAGRQAVTFAGQQKLTSAFFSGEPFGAWAAGAPGGTAIVQTANAPLTNPAGTVARLQCTVAGALQSTIQPIGSCVNGNVYIVEIICSAWTSGAATVVVQPNTGAVVNTTAFAKIDAVGTYRFAFTAAGTNRAIGIEWGNVLCDLQISGFNIWNASRIETIKDWATELLINRGGLDAADVDLSGTIGALDFVTGYLLNYFSLSAGNLFDIWLDAVASYTGGSWQSRLGVLKASRLVDPTGLAGSAVATFDSTNIFGDVTWEDDTAPGLSATLAGQQNYSVHSDGEIAGSVLLTSKAAQLQQDYLAVKQSATPFDSFYQAALARAKRATRLSNATNLQSEATRVGTLYAAHRRFWKFQAFLTDAASYTIDPFDIVLLTITDRYGTIIAAGLPVVVISAQSKFLSDLVSFICWG